MFSYDRFPEIWALYPKMYQSSQNKVVLVMAINGIIKLQLAFPLGLMCVSGWWFQVHSHVIPVLFCSPPQGRKTGRLVELLMLTPFLSSLVPLPASTESAASAGVSLLWRLWLSSVLRVSWEQDVSVSKLLYRLFQSFEVHCLQRERPSAL